MRFTQGGLGVHLMKRFVTPDIKGSWSLVDNDLIVLHMESYKTLDDEGQRISTGNSGNIAFTLRDLLHLLEAVETIRVAVSVPGSSVSE